MRLFCVCFFPFNYSFDVLRGESRWLWLFEMLKIVIPPPIYGFTFVPHKQARSVRQSLAVLLQCGVSCGATSGPKYGNPDPDSTYLYVCV